MRADQDGRILVKFSGASRARERWVVEPATQLGALREPSVRRPSSWASSVGGCVSERVMGVGRHWRALASAVFSGRARVGGGRDEGLLRGADEGGGVSVQMAEVGEAGRGGVGEAA